MPSGLRAVRPWCWPGWFWPCWPQRWPWCTAPTMVDCCSTSCSSCSGRAGPWRRSGKSCCWSRAPGAPMSAFAARRSSTWTWRCPNRRGCEWWVMATKSVPSTAAWRLWLVLLALALLMALLIWRLLTLQVLDTERGYAFLQGQGKARTVRSEVIPAHRGQILDRNGLPLAISTPVATLWANPRELADARADWPRLAGALDLPPAQRRRGSPVRAAVLPAHRGQFLDRNGFPLAIGTPVATLWATPRELADARADWPRLAGALDLPPEQLSRRIQRNAGREFMYLARHLAPEEAERIMALQLPGVYLRNEYRRFYPAGEVLAQLVGITNVDDQGQEGLELAYDHWLAGSPGRKQVLKNLRGQVVRELGESVPARPGQDLQLAIDLRLQYLAYRELKAALVRHQARSGSIVMLDSQSGEVLAMVNQPSFNPNNRRQYRPEAARNRAVTDLMEPGSTVKPMTLVAALESGRYSLDSTVDTSPGHLRVGGKTLLDPVNYGELDLAHVLAKSSQVGISKIALSLQPEDLWEVFSRFGLGQLTDSGFPGEQPGLLLNRPRWQPIEQATLSFGYGLSVTPLQLARAYAVFAAEKQWRPVSMLRVTAPPEGRQVKIGRAS